MPETPDDPLRPEREAFTEELAQYWENEGLPRMDGRVLGHLMVCSPALQTAEDIATALGISRGSVSTSMRMAVRAGAVERVTVPGSRRHHYRVRPGMWRQEIDNRVRQATAVRQLAEDGLKRLAGAPPEDLDRLRDLYEMYDFLVGEYSAIRDRWHERESDRDSGKGTGR
ncbi:GbsR/MarR family transcriptional regulator [Nocardiopsis sediminis]|uniref:GbsR/MarR family transcriptional regulator n=1 Tax=Nocardiopsis sediminis TaxID=1778267 RepID=A0ABV8FRV4_9ACTN